MAARDISDGSPRKAPRNGLFNITKMDDSSTVEPSEQPASPGPASGDGILNQKDTPHNFGVALDLLKSVGDGTGILTPLKIVCGGLKILMNTVQVGRCPCSVSRVIIMIMSGCPTE
jgi:hypothetical protein